MKNVTAHGLERSTGNTSTELQMTPMIDCVFLLLIFFMVATIMRVNPPFPLHLPDSLKREDFPRKRYNVFVSEKGNISLDEMPMQGLDDLELHLASHEQKIDTLIIKADRNARHGIVIDIMERAKKRFTKIEGQSIAIAIKEGEYAGEF